MHVFARLAPGVDVDDPRPDLQGWFATMLEEDARRDGFPNVAPEQRSAFLGSAIDVLPAANGVSNLRAVLERPLLVLMGGILLLLLLACFNVGGLLLARGAARRGELATRMALGASRRRVTRQLLVESLLITLGGGTLGLMAAPAISGLLLALLTWSDDLQSRFDSRTFLFAFLASAVAAGLCGLAPLLQTGRVSLIASLKEQSRDATGARAGVRKALVVGQMALTLLLLIGAGLFVQTLSRLHAQVGFDGRGLIMFSVSPTSAGYSEEDAEAAMREVLRRVQEIPAVEHAAVANTFMLSGGWSTRGITIQTGEQRIVADRSVPYLRVGPGFFSTLGIEVIAGREFDGGDARAPGGAPRAWRSAIVNQSFARRYFDGRTPVGSRLGVGTGPDTVANIEIIGVVRDFSRRSLRDGPIEHVFVPYWDRDSDGGAIYVRVRGEPEAAFAEIRAAVEQVDRALPVSSLTTYMDQVDRASWTERALATLVTSFGLIALLLSVVGLYGVMSFVVTERRREIGLRMALGATRTAAVWLIVRDALIMIVAAAMVAIPCAWGLRRLVESQVFGVRAADAPTIAVAGSLLTLAALVAALVPAWRVVSANPTAALRLE
jgi:predicted permease